MRSDGTVEGDATMDTENDVMGLVMEKDKRGLKKVEFS